MNMTWSIKFGLTKQLAFYSIGINLRPDVIDTLKSNLFSKTIDPEKRLQLLGLNIIHTFQNRAQCVSCWNARCKVSKRRLCCQSASRSWHYPTGLPVYISSVVHRLARTSKTGWSMWRTSPGCTLRDPMESLSRPLLCIIIQLLSEHLLVVEGGELGV